MFRGTDFAVWQTSSGKINKHWFYFPTLQNVVFWLSVIESSGNATDLILHYFPHCHERLFFFFLHCNCLHLRHTEKSSCWGGRKALQKRLESPAWILWQRMREAIQNCSQATVAASTPMLLLYFMQAQISCATVILRLALSVWLPFLSQYSSQWAQKLNPFIDTSISLPCYIRWQHDSFWMSQTNWETKQLLIKERYITFK